MTTTVYRMPSATARISHSALICHLRCTTPEEAIAKLQKAGVLAIPGAECNSIVLVGYHLEIRHLLDDWRIHGFPRRPDSRYTIGKLRHLSTCA